MDIDHQDAVGHTALFYSAIYGNEEICALLLKFGATPSLEDNQGKNPLTYAKRYGNPMIVRMLEGKEAKKGKSYHLCFSNDSDGEPIPLTVEEFNRFMEQYPQIG